MAWRRTGGVIINDRDAAVLRKFVRPGKVRQKEVESVLSKKTLEGLRELGSDIGPFFFRDLLETFEHNALKHLTLMRSAAAHGETARLGREAHSLKGASLTVGAGGMANICAELERAEPERCEEMTSLTLTRLQREFDLVQKEIEFEKMA